MLRVALLTSRRAPGIERLLARSGRHGWRLVAALTSDRECLARPILEGARVPVAIHDFDGFAAPRGLRPRRRGPTDCELAVRREYDRGIAERLAPHRPDLVVLCGWRWILAEPMLERYPDRIVNVHDSDLTIAGPDGRPLYRGLHSTRDAVAAGELETRSTVHLVTPEVDVGPLLVRSWAFPVHPLAVDAVAWAARDVVSAYAYAQREWMMRASWAILLERAIVRHARGEIRVLGGRAIVAGALGPEEMDPIARTAATPIGRAAGGGIR